MNIIICGSGLVGYNIARYLIKEGQDVTVVDNNPEIINQIKNDLDCCVILGYASNPEILEKAGASDSDMIIAVTKSDEVNMIICHIASKMFKIPRKLARIREQCYLSSKCSFLFDNEGIPIDIIISPEREIAKTITNRILISGAFYVSSMFDGNVKIIGTRVLEDSQALNMPIDHLIAEYINLDLIIV